MYDGACTHVRVCNTYYACTLMHLYTHNTLNMHTNALCMYTNIHKLHKHIHTKHPHTYTHTDTHTHKLHNHKRAQCKFNLQAINDHFSILVMKTSIHLINVSYLKTFLVNAKYNHYLAIVEKKSY